MREAADETLPVEEAPVTTTIALAGDTMLGRNVAAQLEHRAPSSLVAEEVAGLARSADLTVLNLECCVSDRGEPWPDPAKPFFFRAPPVAVEVLTHLGVDLVTLANNHALDFGPEALLDTLDHLTAAGIRMVGAGPDVVAARRPAILAAGEQWIRVSGLTDHPLDFAATSRSPGVAHAQLDRELPRWVVDAIAGPGRAVGGDDAGGSPDAVVVTPHWGPNMVREPVHHVRRAAEELLVAGATVVAGHSAHVFHGVRWITDPSPAVVLYDLGDFLDDYAVDPVLRNDLGLLWLVTFEGGVPVAVEAQPLRLQPSRTEPAVGDDRAWIVQRLTAACAPWGTVVEDTGELLRLRMDRDTSRRRDATRAPGRRCGPAPG